MALSNKILLSQISGNVCVLILSLCIFVPLIMSVNSFKLVFFCSKKNLIVNKLLIASIQYIISVEIAYCLQLEYGAMMDYLT